MQMITIDSLNLEIGKDSSKLTLKPFINTTEQAKFLYDLLNTKNVYETLRDGNPWSKKLVAQKSSAYDTGLQEILNLHFQYNPKTFTICWLIYNAKGTPIGRCGLQPDTNLMPILTDIFGAILPQYQNQGIASYASVAIINWFRNNISKTAIFRGLALIDNIPSQQVLYKNGFTNVLENGKNITVDAWQKKYLVFERLS